MQITRNSLNTAAGPEDWFTGAVYVDTVATPSGQSSLASHRRIQTESPDEYPPGG